MFNSICFIFNGISVIPLIILFYVYLLAWDLHSLLQKQLTMNIKVNKHIVKAGEVIDVSWDASEGIYQELILKSGDKETSIPVSPSGTKRFRMKGGNLFNSVLLRSQRDGKEVTSRSWVVVWGGDRSQSTTRSYAQSSSGKLSSRIGQYFKNLKTAWTYMPQGKKQLYYILMALLCYQTVALYSYPIASFCMIGILLYIFWLLIKK